MIKRFLASGRSGFYFSVVEPGEVRSGSEIEILSRDANGVTVADIQQLYLRQDRDQKLLERAIHVSALPENWKGSLLERSRARG